MGCDDVSGASQCTIKSGARRRNCDVSGNLRRHFFNQQSFLFEEAKIRLSTPVEWANAWKSGRQELGVSDSSLKNYGADLYERNSGVLINEGSKDIVLNGLKIVGTMDSEFEPINQKNSH